MHEETETETKTKAVLAFLFVHVSTRWICVKPHETHEKCKRRTTAEAVETENDKNNPVFVLPGNEAGGEGAGVRRNRRARYKHACYMCGITGYWRSTNPCNRLIPTAFHVVLIRQAHHTIPLH